MTKISQYTNLYFMIPLVLAILRDNYLKLLISIISLKKKFLCTMKIVRFNMTQNLKIDNNKKIIKSTM